MTCVIGLGCVSGGICAEAKVRELKLLHPASMTSLTPWCSNFDDSSRSVADCVEMRAWRDPSCYGLDYYVIRHGTVRCRNLVSKEHRLRSGRAPMLAKVVTWRVDGTCLLHPRSLTHGID